MATADSVKAKLQGLIDKSNATTGNTDADLTTAVDALVAGYGQGGGGGCIIDVTELPTDGIDEQSIYRLENAAGGAKLYVVADADNDGTMEIKMTVEEFFKAMMGASVTINTKVVENLPEILEPADEATLTFTVYVVESTGVAYTYMDGEVMTAGRMCLGADGYNKGWTNAPLDETEMGVYCVKTYAYTYHGYKNGVWTELSNSVSGERGGVIYIQLKATDGLLSPASGTLTDEQYARIKADPKNIAIDMIDSYDNPSHLILPCVAWVTGNKYLYKSFEANEKYLFTYLLTVNSDKTWGYTIILKEL